MAVVQAVPGARQPLQAVGEQNAGCVAYAQQTALYDDIPIVVHANEQKALKSEDVIYVRRVEPSYGNVHSIFVVCDGHQGAGAANHCVEHMPGLLGQLLPPGLPDWRDMREVAEYAEKVRRAISTAAVLLDNDWARKCEMSDGAETAGTTLTMAVVSGWLLTVTNTGDSNAIIDTGDSVQEITHSHRIQVNKSEQNRLRQSGAQLAPLGFHLQGPAKPQEMGVGPLRMWPGGLCVSRSIGDLDAGPLIVPLPHIRQVLLTRHRALRLIMASDGLWDLMSFNKAAKSVRHKLPHQAVNTLVQMVARDKRMADDVSIIIVDLLPPPAVGIMPQQFPASALQASTKGSSASSSLGSSTGSSSKSSKSGGGGLFSCFKGSAVHEPTDTGYHSGTGAAPNPHAMTPGGPLTQPWNGLQFLADVDCYEAYPVHGQQLARVSVPVARRPSPPPKQKGDYTVHGGHAHQFQQDSSWHTGESQHGPKNFPMFLSQQQLKQLQTQGPAAAAGMTLSPASQSHDMSGRDSSSCNTADNQGSPFEQYVPQAAQQDQMLLMMDSGVLNNTAAAAAGGGSEGRVRRGNTGGAAAAAAAGSYATDLANNGLRNPSTGLPSRPSQRLPTPAYDTTSGGAASTAPGLPAGPRTVTFGAVTMAGTASEPVMTSSASASSAGRPILRPSSPGPRALHRSASAEFENPDGSGVYVAGDEGVLAAPGRVVAVPAAVQGVSSHFGSAPCMVPGVSRGGQQGPVSLAAAATAAEHEDEEGLRAIGVRSALAHFQEGPGAGI